MKSLDLILRIVTLSLVIILLIIYTNNKLTMRGNVGKEVLIEEDAFLITGYNALIPSYYLLNGATVSASYVEDRLK